MRQHYDQYVVRFPDGLRDTLKVAAVENGRSMNAEIIFHLRKALGAAAGGEFGDQAPAAKTAQEMNHQGAPKHAAE